MDESEYRMTNLNHELTRMRGMDGGAHAARVLVSASSPKQSSLLPFERKVRESETLSPAPAAFAKATASQGDGHAPKPDELALRRDAVGQRVGYELSVTRKRYRAILLGRLRYGAFLTRSKVVPGIVARDRQERPGGASRCCINTFPAVVSWMHWAVRRASFLTARGDRARSIIRDRIN